MSKEPAEILPAGMKLSKKLPTPLYQQVYQQFREMILTRRLRPGDRLPATRNLAKELGVSRVIISQGFEQLMMEGYLIGKTGSGTFVAELLPDHLLQAEKPENLSDRSLLKLTPETGTKNRKDFQIQKEEVLPFQIGTPSLDQFPYKIWQQVAAKVLKGLKSYHLGYDDTLGYRPLRKAIAAYLRLSRAVNCDAEQVIIVTGSQQGLNLIVDCLLKPGDKVWMEDPGYFGATQSFEHAKVKICPVPVEQDGLDIAYASKSYPDAKLVYVTPSHQFPLGYTLSQIKRIELLAWANEKKRWIIEDDYDSEFRYEGQPLASLQGLDRNKRVIYSGTFSKVLFPGLRLAYLVLPSLEMVALFKKRKENIDRQSPVMDQLIVTDFMNGGYFLRHIRKMRLLYAGRQQMLLALLQTQAANYCRVEVHPSGMHLLCWLEKSVNIEKFREEAAQQKLVISFINDYSFDKKMPPAISLGFTAFSKYKLVTGVEKLMNCFRNASFKRPEQ